MFGYLDAPKACRIDGAAHTIYRRFFCGLCNAMRREYGLLSRWLINRDSTFLALLTAAQSTEEPVPTETTCCNPLGQKRALFESGPHAEFAAAVTVCGLWTKLRDDLEDERGLRRWRARIALPLLRRPTDRARRRLEAVDFPYRDVERHLQRQPVAEREGRDLNDLDALTAPTANAFGQILEQTGVLAKRPENRPHLQAAGAALGRVVYLLDSVEDREEDQKHRRFNPLELPVGGRIDPDALFDATSTFFDRCLEEIRQSLAAVQLARFHDLIDRIVIRGLTDRCKRALALLMSTLPNENPPPASDGSASPPSDPEDHPQRESKMNLCCDGCYCCGECTTSCDSCGSGEGFACCRTNCCCDGCSCSEGCSGCDCG